MLQIAKIRIDLTRQALVESSPGEKAVNMTDIGIEMNAIAGICRRYVDILVAFKDEVIASSRIIYQERP